MADFVEKAVSEQADEETKQVPCRLFFLLAREANTGVIFRRGPSKWVQVIRWDTANDRFERGQWFHGRIYEKRCDLSPDGKLLIYFVSKFNRRTRENQEYTYAWTAISKPPYLTALALWPKGDCWHGGGLFEDNRTVWLNHSPGSAQPHPDHKPQGLKVTPNPHAHGEDFPVLLPRLERDGWKQQQEWKIRYEYSNGFVTDQPLIYKKYSPDRQQKLVMTASIVRYADQYRYELRSAGGRVEIEGAEWADWDQRGRLVFVREGKLFTNSADAPGNFHARELADFNGERPHLIAAPDWAKRW
jgi:hypothetical protein